MPTNQPTSAIGRKIVIYSPYRRVDTKEKIPIKIVTIDRITKTRFIYGPLKHHWVENHPSNLSTEQELEAATKYLLNKAAKEQRLESERAAREADPKYQTASRMPGWDVEDWMLLDLNFLNEIWEKLAELKHNNNEGKK